MKADESVKTRKAQKAWVGADTFRKTKKRALSYKYPFKAAFGMYSLIQQLQQWWVAFGFSACQEITHASTRHPSQGVPETRRELTQPLQYTLSTPPRVALLSLATPYQRVRGVATNVWDRDCHVVYVEG